MIATGWCDRPAVPAVARHLDPAIAQVAPAAYRNPDALPAGGVLVVGASATGVQLADELARAGRDVVLAVGSHSRLPRRYRGMDIFWWLERIGSLDRTIDEMPDPIAARHEPSLQLVGRPDHRTLDLATLQAAGVELDRAAHRRRRPPRRLRRRPRAHRRRRPTPGCDGSSPRSTPTSTPAASPPRSSTRSPSPASTVADPPDRLDLRAARHHVGDLGDRPPAHLPVAAPPGARRGGRDPPAPRRHARTPACTSSGSASSTTAAPTSSTASVATPPIVAAHLAGRASPLTRP